MRISSVAVVLLILLAAPLLAKTVPVAGSGPDLPTPDGLAPAVAFWTRIYGELDSASGLVHDSRDLQVVYATLYLNPAAPPVAQDEAIGKALDEYRTALLALARGKHRPLTAVEQRALAPWGEGASAQVLEEAAARLRFQRGQSDRFRRGLVRSARWRAQIRSILRRHGLPEGLAALPHVESSYNPEAVSKAGAVGLWQFMPATARRYLRVDEQVDERLDPIKSSEAAALLLQHNHRVLGSWPLAITAYNHGLSGVRRAVRETGSDDLGEIARQYESERFGFASRNFYAAFLAALAVSSHPGRHFREQELDALDPVVVSTPAYLPVEVLVEGFGIEKERLRALNPGLHHEVWNGARFVPQGYTLKLPGVLDAARAEARMALLGEHFGFSAQRPSPYYEVRAGDSLSQIAMRHGLDADRLQAMNGLASADEIHPGQVLRVPLDAAPKPLGPGAATILAALRAMGDTNGDAAEAVDVSRLIAAVTGDGEGGTVRALQASLKVGPCAGAVGVRVAAAVPGGSKDGEGSPLLAETQPDLAADPLDYSVAADGTIEIQIGETLGHYAEWLDLHSRDLRSVNGFGEKDALIVGRRLKLDFARVTPRLFEERRIAHHKARQLAYFRGHRIVGVVEHPIIAGDSLWLLAVDQYRIPLWLLRQYNPDVQVDTVLPLGGVIFVPFVDELAEEEECSPRELSADASG